MGCGTSSPEIKSVEAAAMSRAMMSRPLEDVRTLEQVTGGAVIPQLFLALHSNTSADSPRLSIVGLDGSLLPVGIENDGLATARDLTCLFMISKEVTRQPGHLYLAVQADGTVHMFSLLHKGGSYLAVSVTSFQLPHPSVAKAGQVTCDGARAYVAASTRELHIEWICTGPSQADSAVTSWVSTYRLDINAALEDDYQVKLADVNVTFLRDRADGDVMVRQLADLGQGAAMAQWGTLCVSDKGNGMGSYIMRREPHPSGSKMQHMTPQFQLSDVKVKAILDATPELSVYVTDDDASGAQLWVLNRHWASHWGVKLRLPPGAEPLNYSICGLATIAPPAFRPTKTAGTLSEVTHGTYTSQRFLMLHDSRAEGLPRLSVVDLQGQVKPVTVTDAELASAQDLQSMFKLDKERLKLAHHSYVVMAASGKCWLFHLEAQDGQVTTADVLTFTVPPPLLEEGKPRECQVARAYLEDGTLFMEYGSRGGLSPAAKASHPWVARTILQLADISAGTFAVDPAEIHVTSLPAVIDDDPTVQQLAHMGQSSSMSRHGMLFVAAKDDDGEGGRSVSYILQRLAKGDLAASTNAMEVTNEEGIVPLYIKWGHRIGAILDLNPELSVYGGHDADGGVMLGVLQRSSGLEWCTQLELPTGLPSGALGVCGLATLDL